MVTYRNRLGAFLLGLTCLLAAVAASPIAQAATITVVNHDGAGEGFNDPTPVAPVGGNSGTTLGAQRLNAFKFAANLWGALIDSAVEIRVGANFDPLFCTASSAVLGSAGPVSVTRDFVGAPVANTWFPIALANALRGGDMNPGADDIAATFNSSIGTTCAFPLPWYYGLDATPPGSQIDFATVVLHELGHGLGFLTVVDLTTGAKLGGLDDAYMLNLENHTTGKLYPNMTDAERVAASTNTANLHWIGAQVKAASGVLTSGRVNDHVQMFAPNPQQPGSSVSHFDTALTPNEVMEPVYTGPRHTPGLALPLFHDIGWSSSTVALAVTKAGTGSGTVTSSPAGINCGTTCSASFASGAAVSLTAAPASGSTFAGWSGACSGTGLCNVTMNAATAVTATFNASPTTFALTVTKAGTGGGTVTSSPAGINCGTTCSANYASGTVVTLTATPAAGSTFAGWTGACSGTAACSVATNVNTAVTATFNTTFSLTVTKTGTGSGTVTSSPTGINCGTTCSASFASGSAVTLTAASVGGSTFAGWSGACAGTGACVVSMTQNRSVTAAFTPSATLTSLAPNVTFPVTVGTPVTWTATASGGIAPLQYRFWDFNVATGVWTMVRDYATSNTFIWTPAPADTGQHRFGVWVRNAGSTAPYETFLGYGPFTISGSVATLTSLAPNVTFPVSVGTPVTWTATASGGIAPLQYRFWDFNVATGVWTMVRDYATSNTFIWTPTPADTGQHRFGVWVRSAGSTAPYESFFAYGPFTIGG